MKAVYFAGNGIVEVREMPDPQIAGDHDVIVEVELAGVCGTDVHIASVPQLHPARDGVVLGHEFVGRVVEVGRGVRGLRCGDAVTVGPNIPCGECEVCRCGRRNLCERNVTVGITRDGGFATFASVPAFSLYPVPEGMCSRSAVFAEPLACVMNGMRLLRDRRRERAVVLGAGPIGIYFLRVLRHFGSLQLVATEPNPTRREFARKSGAMHAIDPTRGDAVEAVLDLTRGGADVVIDTTGRLLGEALAMTRRGGTVLLFGMDLTCTSGVPTFDVVRNEKMIVGCFANTEMIPSALELIPHLGVDELITHEFSLQDVGRALEVIRMQESIKTVLTIDERTRMGGTEPDE